MSRPIWTLIDVYLMYLKFNIYLKLLIQMEPLVVTWIKQTMWYQSRVYSLVVRDMAMKCCAITCVIHCPRPDESFSSQRTHGAST